MTKRENFEAIMNLENVTEEIKAFCIKEIALLDKKKASGSKAETEKQKANALIKDRILELIGNASEKGLTCTEVTYKLNADRVEALHPNKVSALLSQMRRFDGTIARNIEKGVSRFVMAEVSNDTPVDEAE